MTAASLHQIGEMTEAEYDAERARIRALYGEGGREASALADQALCAFFRRSGWTQERLAQKEGKSQNWVCYRIRFGAFLENITAVINPDLPPILKALTERKFRGYWERTSGTNDYQRFAAVQRELLADLALSKSHVNKPKVLGKAIASLADDGVWHYLPFVVAHAQKVCAALDPPVPVRVDDVAAVLEGMRKRGTHGVLAKKEKGAKGARFLIVRAGRTIKLDALMEDLGPILEALKVEGEKSVAKIVPATVAHLAGQLEQLIEKWSRVEQPSPRGDRSTKELTGG